jgi:hypothetical protein
MKVYEKIISTMKLAYNEEAIQKIIK